MQKSEPAQRVALVTGASRNIGRAIAVSLARSGCIVACFGRDARALGETAELVRRAGGTPSVFVGDARSNRSLEEFAAHAVAAHGGIDIVINNAGIVHEARPESTTVEKFLDVLQVNLVSQFTLARAAHGSMKSRGGGAVVNIGSLAGAVAFPRTAAYCASKAGIDGLTRALAYDWAADNIRVLCVAPGYVKSDISSGALSDERTRSWVLQRIPMRRIAEPEEIGEFVAFLVSSRASFCTGETFYVDGGQRMAI
jgi:NAD(P)-dependent dehydrogenase (short-subunit alcohol dehydrogenase family)